MIHCISVFIKVCLLMIVSPTFGVEEWVDQNQDQDYLPVVTGEEARAFPVMDFLFALSTDRQKRYIEEPDEYDEGSGNVDDVATVGDNSISSTASRSSSSSSDHWKDEALVEKLSTWPVTFDDPLLGRSSPWTNANTTIHPRQSHIRLQGHDVISQLPESTVSDHAVTSSVFAGSVTTPGEYTEDSTTAEPGRSEASQNLDEFTAATDGTEDITPTIEISASSRLDLSTPTPDLTDTTDTNQSEVLMVTLEPAISITVSDSSTFSTTTGTNSTEVSVTSTDDAGESSTSNYLWTSTAHETSSTTSPSDPCDALKCGPNERCYNISHFVACQCLPGFVPSSLGCLCPASKVYSDPRLCREANQVFQTALTLFGYYSPHLDDLQSQSSRTLVDALKQNMTRFLVKLAKPAVNLAMSVAGFEKKTASHRANRASSSRDEFLPSRFLCKMFIKFSSPDVEDVPSQRAVTESLQAFVNSTSTLLNEYSLPNQTVVLEDFDYCVEGQHNCHLSTTQCSFERENARISCACLPGLTRVNEYTCAFINGTVPAQFYARAREDASVYQMVVYILAVLLALLLLLVFGMVLLLRLRPTKEVSIKKTSVRVHRNGNAPARFDLPPIPRATLIQSPPVTNPSFFVDTTDTEPDGTEGDLDMFRWPSDSSPDDSGSMRLLLQNSPRPRRMRLRPPPPSSMLTDLHSARKDGRPSEALNPGVTTFRRGRHAITGPISTIYSVYSDNSGATSAVEMSDYASSASGPYATPGQPGPGHSVRFETERRLINAFDGERYRSTEGMIFSMDDRPAVHQAQQEHRLAALRHGPKAQYHSRNNVSYS